MFVAHLIDTPLGLPFATIPGEHRAHNENEQHRHKYRRDNSPGQMPPIGTHRRGFTSGKVMVSRTP